MAPIAEPSSSLKPNECPTHLMLLTMFDRSSKDIKGWLFIIFFGLTIYTFCFPGFIIINFFNNYKKHNPSQDEYLREVIESMKSK
jgi:hypothetical protein